MQSGLACLWAGRGPDVGVARGMGGGAIALGWTWPPLGVGWSGAASPGRSWLRLALGGGLVCVLGGGALRCLLPSRPSSPLVGWSRLPLGSLLLPLCGLVRRLGGGGCRWGLAWSVSPMLPPQSRLSLGVGGGAVYLCFYLFIIFIYLCIYLFIF